MRVMCDLTDKEFSWVREMKRKIESAGYKINIVYKSLETNDLCIKLQEIVLSDHYYKK